MVKGKIIAVALAAAFFVIGCDIQKKQLKSKSDTSFNENIETREKRKGDTIRYDIPKITYRDTVIYRISREGTTIRTTYDKQGNIQVDCIASAVDLVTKINRELQQSQKDKDSEKTEKFNTVWILYVCGAIALIVIIFMFLMFKAVTTNTKMLNILAERMK